MENEKSEWFEDLNHIDTNITSLSKVTSKDNDAPSENIVLEQSYSLHEIPRPALEKNVNFCPKGNVNKQDSKSTSGALDLIYNSDGIANGQEDQLNTKCITNMPAVQPVEEAILIQSTHFPAYEDTRNKLVDSDTSDCKRERHVIDGSSGDSDNVISPKLSTSYEHKDTNSCQQGNGIRQDLTVNLPKDVEKTSSDSAVDSESILKEQEKGVTIQLPEKVIYEPSACETKDSVELVGDTLTDVPSKPSADNAENDLPPTEDHLTEAQSVQRTLNVKDDLVPPQADAVEVVLDTNEDNMKGSKEAKMDNSVVSCLSHVMSDTPDALLSSVKEVNIVENALLQPDIVKPVDPVDDRHDPGVGMSNPPFFSYIKPGETESQNDNRDGELSPTSGVLKIDGNIVIHESDPVNEETDRNLEVITDVTGSILPTVIARRPELLEEASMSSVSSRDSMETDAKAETTKQSSEVESESGSVKEKKKAPAKRRNDLTQRMEEVPTSQLEESRPEEHLFEYRWPLEGHSDMYMLQEQISEYLGVLSFKRKYPDLERRNIVLKERVYLREKGVVTEMQADLGLTAVRADLIHELMARDYPQKYKLYLSVLKERRKQQALEKHREMLAQKTDKTRLEQLRQKAMQSASKFNAAFNRERREERRAYFDIHTFEIQYPRKQSQILPPEATKPGAYPVSLIPGQFQDYHKRYTPTELKYLPVNTTMYSSPCKVHNLYADPAPLPSDEEVSADEERSSEVSTESSDVESMEMVSEIFGEEDEDSIQPEPGKTKEEKKVQISRKVDEILERLKDKNKKSPRRKPKPAGDDSPAPKKKKGETETGGDKPKTPQRRKKMASRKVPASAAAGEFAALCNICGGPESHNSSGNKENLVQCSECRRYGHPSCLELTPEMISLIKTYPWQCMECKTCVECKDSQNEDKMLFCDRCDRGYHTFCVGLTTIPNGRWECPSCRPPIPMEVKIPIPSTLTELKTAPTSGVALIAAMPHSKA